MRTEAFWGRAVYYLFATPLWCTTSVFAICALKMSSYELKKMEDVKINNDQAAELAERTAEVFQLRQELQLLRHEVAQSRLAVNPVTNTVKFNISRKSYWAWTGLRGLWREKQSETTSEMLQTFYQQNLNQSRYVSLRNFLGNYSVIYSPVAVYSFYAISKESLWERLK